MNSIPVINSWRMNERHYGALVGLSKEEAGSKLGHSDVIEWRRSWDKAPPKMSHRDLRKWTNAKWAQPTTIISEPNKQKVIATEKGVSVPETESLQDCAQRVLPLWIHGILPRVLKGETVLIVAHANSIRAMVKAIDGDTMSIEDIRSVTIPSAVPLIYDFEEVPSGQDGIYGKSVKSSGVPNSLGMRGKYIVTKELVEMNVKYKSTCFDLDSRPNDTAAGSKTYFDLVHNGVAEALHNALTVESINAHVRDDGNVSRARSNNMLANSKGVVLLANNDWTTLCGFRTDELIGSTGKTLPHVETIHEEPKYSPDVPLYDWIESQIRGPTISASSNSESGSNDLTEVESGNKMALLKESTQLLNVHVLSRLDTSLNRNDNLKTIHGTTQRQE